MAAVEMPLDDQYECAVVLIEYADIIKSAHRGRHLVPADHEPVVKDRIRAIVNLGSVLNSDEDRTLCKALRRVLDAVLGPREFETIADDDFKMIASRYPEWLPEGFDQPLAQRGP